MLGGVADTCIGQFVFVLALCACDVRHQSLRHQVADEQSDQEQDDRIGNQHREPATEVGLHLAPLVRFVVF